MQKFLAFAGLVALVSACANLSGMVDDAAVQAGGYASSTGASFMGFHGPVYRVNRNDNQGPP